MKKIIVTTAAFFILTGCKKEAEKIPSDADTVSVQQKQPGSIEKSHDLVLEDFDFPKEFEGCSCYFSRDRKSFEAGKYIYADDFGSQAIVNFDGKKSVIALTSSNTPEDDVLTKQGTGDDVQISIQANRVKQMEESLIFEGTLTAETTDGRKITMPVYGECGC